MPTPSAWRIETHPHGLATLWFDRPGSSQNTLDGETLNQLAGALEQVEAATDLRGLMVRSAKPKGLCAGADLKALRACQTQEEVELLLHQGLLALEKLRDLPIPTLAVVQGTCLGGGLELALACDGIAAIDRPETKLGTPEIKLGLIPGWGAIAELCRRLGPRRGIDMLMTGETISAREGLRFKLVDLITTPETIQADMLRFMESKRRKRRQTPRSEVDAPGATTSANPIDAEESLAYLIKQELAGVDIRNDTVVLLARLVVSQTARASIDALFKK